MNIKAQILTFREAFYLTEKGRAYFQQRLQERIDTENAEPIQLSYIDGKWQMGTAHRSYDDSDLHRVFRYAFQNGYEPHVGFDMNEFHEEFNRKIMEDLMNANWFKTDR